MAEAGDERLVEWAACSIEARILALAHGKKNGNVMRCPHGRCVSQRSRIVARVVLSLRRTGRCW